MPVENDGHTPSVTTLRFAGFERNLRLDSGPVSIVATLEVGPRILYLGPGDSIEERGANLLAVYEHEEGMAGGAYRSFGGHRLWVSPEKKPSTYAPESDPPQYRQDGGVHTFERAGNLYGIAKRLEIRSLGNGAYALRHTITNVDDAPQTVAPWAITVMAPGGECLVPQHAFIPHTERLLPVRPLVFWGYARMDDPRFTWGDRVLRLRHDASRGPIKIGALVKEGIAAYARGGHTFVKRFACEGGAIYPDYGCNFETFARENMLEVESLGPLRELDSGDTAVLEETWYLLLNELPPTDDAACGEWFERIMAQYPLRSL